MKILHINFSENKGGASKIMQALVKFTRVKGLHAEVLCARPINKNINFIGYKLFNSLIPYKIHHKLSVIKNRFINDTDGICSALYLKKIKKLKPNVVHIHNIHGGWFDLKLLTKILKTYPVVWTIHDMWLLTGHCTINFGCEKYLEGCGDCPNLNIDYKLYIDRTQNNWRVRKDILSNASKYNLTLVTVSDWLNKEVAKTCINNNQSLTIHNGINLKSYYPDFDEKMKLSLGFEESDKIIVSSAVGGIKNKQKNLKLILEAYKILSKKDSKIKLMLIGGTLEGLGVDGVLQIDFVTDINMMRKYYSISDLMVYPTLNDTFGLVVAECLACNTPVIASKVQGVQDLLPNEYMFSKNISISSLSELIFQTLNKSDSHKDLFKSNRNKFNEDLMGTRYLNLYKKILNE